jgi:hypothetical protein
MRVRSNSFMRPPLRGQGFNLDSLISGRMGAHAEYYLLDGIAFHEEQMVNPFIVI